MKLSHGATKQEEATLTAFVAFGRENISKAIQLFDSVVVPVMTAGHVNQDGRAGAVLDICNCSNTMLLHTRSGTAPDDKFFGYEDNARAKNIALNDYPSFMTSWQVHSGDTSQKPYPGAIRTRHNDRISISGFTWQRDTIGSLWIAQNLDRMSYYEALEVADMCGIREEFIQTMEKLNVAHRLLATA